MIIQCFGPSVPLGPNQAKVFRSHDMPVQPFGDDELALSKSAKPVLGIQSRQVVVEAGAAPGSGAALASFDGLAWSGAMSGNGGQDGIVLLPRGFNPALPAEVVVHFHGDGNTAVGSASSLLRTIEQASGADRNALVVIPSGEKGWNQAKLTQLQDDGVAIASRLTGQPVKAGSYTVSAHSGGGLAVFNAAMAKDLRVSHLNLHDSTYTFWGDVAVQKRSPGSSVNVFYTEHNRARANRLKGPGVTLEFTRADHSDVPKQFFWR